MRPLIVIAALVLLGSWSSFDGAPALASGASSIDLSATSQEDVRVTADGRTVSGCGGGTIAPNTLAGTSWAVVSINSRPTPGGAGYYIQFSDKSLSAKFGCNAMGGAYKTNGDHLAVGDLEQTLMGCPEPAATFEREGSDVLRSNVRVEKIGGERLRLVSEAGAIELKRAI